MPKEFSLRVGWAGRGEEGKKEVNASSTFGFRHDP